MTRNGSPNEVEANLAAIFDSLSKEQQAAVLEKIGAKKLGPPRKRNHGPKTLGYRTGMQVELRLIDSEMVSRRELPKKPPPEVATIWVGMVTHRRLILCTDLETYQEVCARSKRLGERLAERKKKELEDLEARVHGPLLPLGPSSGSGG